MTVDYLSTLNSKGSGLNITQLVGSIVDAEIEPAKALVNDKSSANDLSVSEVGMMRSRMSALQTGLQSAGTGGLFNLQSSSEAVSMTVTDNSALSAGVTQLGVTQLASVQVLEFGGYSAADATLSAGTLTVEVGAWENGTFSANGDVDSRLITLSSSSTLSDLAAELDGLDGITAQVVDKGNGTFSLSVVSEMGKENALRFTASTGGPADFDTTDGSNEVTAASNAEIVLNGITLERPSNRLSDIMPGVELTLASVTSSAASLNVVQDRVGATAQLQALVSDINTLRSYLDTATARGFNGAASGALAGDAGIAAIKREISALTTTPLNGFGSEPLYLSEIGVRTELDGTLSLDEELLNDVFETSPEKFQAVYQSLYTIEQSNLGVSFGFTSQPPEGVYNFVYDADAETATINGQSLSSRRNSEGQQEFYRLTGDFDGITIKVLEGAPVDSEVYIGVSLVDKLSKYFEGVLGKQGEILAKETYFREKATEYIEALSDLDERAVVLEARELKRFAKMEQMVTQLKSTGEYITTMMDAWSKSD